MKNKLLIICILTLPLIFNYHPANSQNIPDFLVNEQISLDGSEQSTPYIDGDGNGNYVITWKDKRNGRDFDIYAQIYLSNGTTLGNNLKVSDDGGTTSQYRPAIAVDPNLNFVITWLDKRHGHWDIYAQRFSNDGTALGSNFKVNDDQGSEEQEHPSVSIDSCGNFVIIWADERTGDYDIYAQRFSNTGIALGGNFKINDDVGNSLQYWPTSSCDKNGNFIATWVDKRNGDDYDIYAQRFLNDGTALGNNVKVNTDIGDAIQLRPDITIKENGDYIITWEDKRTGNWDIYIQRYLNDGSTLGDNFIIDDNPPDTDQRNPSISTDFAGNFNINWEDDRDDYNDIYARRYSNDGNPIGSSFKVNDNTGISYQYYSEISTDESGNFTITWEDHRLGFNGDIFAQSYLNDGTTIDVNFKVNDDEGSENQESPSIAKDSSNNFIISWTDYRSDYGYNYGDIYAQRFSIDGTALGNNFKVNDDTIGNILQYASSIAADADGNFIITWTDFRSGYCSDVYAQRYSSDGTALGSNFIVNNIGSSMHYGPAVVCKKNGDFIITWGDSDDGGLNRYRFRQLNDSKILESDFSTKNKGTEPDIYAQQYLSDGTPLGENFMVNDDVEYTYQECPAIAVDTSGNFIIAWEDNRNGDWDIYIQRYLSDGTPLGSNFMVEDSVVSDYQWGASISIDESSNFFVAWKDNRNGDFDIFAQRYLNDATAIGNNFQVNSDTGYMHQSSPCISANGNGNFIITWSDRHSGNHDVYAQRYLSNGLPLGSNYRISNTGEMEQYGSVVILDNNKIYATWQDNRGGQTGYDIWANVFDWENFGQEIILHEGFQFISSSIDPTEPDMMVVMAEILNDNQSFVRNSLGQTLLKIGPNWVNGIGDWVVSEGYLVKMFAGDLFTIEGIPVNPATPIQVETGFQFVSYFPENTMDALMAFETILDDNLDFIRNTQGQTLRKIGPIWVNGIGDCQPGEGYLVKMFSAGEIIYPASTKSSSKTTISPTYLSFNGGNPADPVYTMYIKGLKIGDEVAAFDNEIIVGATTILSKNVFDNSMALFSTLTNGEGYTAGNSIKLKIWYTKTGEIVDVKFNMEAIYDSYVSDVYPDEDGKYSIVNITKDTMVVDEKILIFPNPATENITVVSSSKINKVSIFNCFGQSVYERNTNDINIQINTKDFEAGIYVIRVETTIRLETHKIIIK